MFGELLGIGAGLLGGLMGGKDEQQTSTRQQELPDFLKPYAPMYAQQGYNLSQKPFSPYPYEGVAPFTQDQNSAMDMIRQRAMAGSPLTSAAQQQQQGTIQGQYLNQRPDNPYMQQTLDTMGGKYLDPSSNPYLQSTYDQAAGRMTDAFSRGTAAQTDARFARAGAFGGSSWNEMQGANQQALGDSLGGLANSIYGGNYQAERSRQDQAGQYASNQFNGNYNTERLLQQQAALASPGLAAQDYQGASALLGIGGQQQAQGQNYINDDQNRFNQAQQYPYQQFQQFGQLFNPNLGGTTTGTATQPGVGTAQGLLGGAAGGLGIYSMGQQAGLWGGKTPAQGQGYFGGVTPPLLGAWG